MFPSATELICPLSIPLIIPTIIGISLSRKPRQTQYDGFWIRYAAIVIDALCLVVNRKWGEPSERGIIVVPGVSKPTEGTVVSLEYNRQIVSIVRQTYIFS